MLQPIRVDEDHLQVDLIKKVGIGGSYLKQRQTLDYTRSEYVRLWPPHGAEMLELVQAEALEILKNHKTPILSKGIEDQMDEILNEADKRLMQAAPSGKRKQN
jgi:trimethylamine:corrinoid methyltransferase-like protein